MMTEDVGTVDQLSFQAPFLPVAFGPGQAGCLGSFFSATVLPGCPDPNFNALPKSGVIDPTFVPVWGSCKALPTAVFLCMPSC